MKLVRHALTLFIIAALAVMILTGQSSQKASTDLLVDDLECQDPTGGALHCYAHDKVKPDGVKGGFGSILGEHTFVRLSQARGRGILTSRQQTKADVIKSRHLNLCEKQREGAMAS